MTAITNLSARVLYKQNQTDMPVLVVMHGWTDDASDIPIIDLRRMAYNNYFVVAVGMRGRDGAGGSQDGGGRELYDIIDAVTSVRARYSTYVSQTKAALVGYSGGGSNALGVACKFPDFFTVLVDYFGVSDYGYDSTDGWWYTNVDARTELTNWIGNRASVTNPYHARNAVLGISNFTGGKLFMYHDDQDLSIPVVNTTNISAALDAAGLTNYVQNITTTTDSPRWLHGYPHDHQGTLSQAEATWMAEINSRDAWTIAANGTVTVLGYIVTKRFTIWLRANGSSVYGLDASATVVYNTATDTYTVTPLTGAIDVTITQGAKTGTATNITEATEIVVT